MRGEEAPEIRAVTGALTEHIERAVAARVPVLERVIALSEQEVLAVATGVQKINGESKSALHDLEVVAASLSTTRNSGGPQSLGSTITQQDLVYQRFVELCGTTEHKLTAQVSLAGKAAAAVKDMLNIVSEVDGIAQRACITTFNARIESARMGPEGRTFNVIADELRDMTSAVQALNVQIKAIGEGLMKIIPVIASEAGALCKTHSEVSSQLGQQMADAGKSQRHALVVLNDAVLAGRTRTDGIVEQSHEVMARLTFQDRIAQDLGAVINQELASGELLTRSLCALSSEAPPDPADIEREARALEVIRHGPPSESTPSDSDEDSVSPDARPAGEMAFF